MREREHFLLGKRGDEALCEDGFVVNDAFAAVVDGSTSKAGSKKLPAEKSTGRRAMETTLRAIAALPPDAAMEEAARLLTAALRRELTEEMLRDATLRPTCSAVIFSVMRREVWLFGDCQCRIAGTTYTNGKYVDAVLTEARCAALRYLLAHGHTEADLLRRDIGREIIFPLLRDQTNFQNDPSPFNLFRYTVLDGTPIDASTVPIISVPDAGPIVLASDGYPVLCDTLSETEGELQRLLAADPLCISENAATKGCTDGQLSFDDRCYLSVEI